MSTYYVLGAVIGARIEHIIIIIVHCSYSYGKIHSSGKDADQHINAKSGLKYVTKEKLA